VLGFRHSSGGWKPRLQEQNPPSRVGISPHVRRLETASTGAKPAVAGWNQSAQADLDSVGAISNRQRIWTDSSGGWKPRLQERNPPARVREVRAGGLGFDRRDFQSPAYPASKSPSSPSPCLGEGFRVRATKVRCTQVLDSRC
jgi:hypothetical protein